MKRPQAKLILDMSTLFAGRRVNQVAQSQAEAPYGYLIFATGHVSPLFTMG